MDRDQAGCGQGPQAAVRWPCQGGLELLWTRPVRNKAQADPDGHGLSRQKRKVSMALAALDARPQGTQNPGDQGTKCPVAAAGPLTASEHQRGRGGAPQSCSPSSGLVRKEAPHMWVRVAALRLCAAPKGTRRAPGPAVEASPRRRWISVRGVPSAGSCPIIPQRLLRQ